MFKKTTFLFDLDGTLLPMDNDIFTKAYFSALTKRVAPLGYEAKGLVDAIWGGTKAMVANDGSKPNEEAFWQFFASIYGEKSREHIPVFDRFYRNEFWQAKDTTGFTPLAARCIKALRAKGYTVALATNPIFPAVATDARIQWAGLDKEDFDLITTYENFNYCKPNPKYYLEILNRLCKDPSECVMVGNDVGEDIRAAQKAGLDTILIPDCLINRDDGDISDINSMTFEQLLEYIEALPGA